MLISVSSIATSLIFLYFKLSYLLLQTVMRVPGCTLTDKRNFVIESRNMNNQVRVQALKPKIVRIQTPKLS